MRLQGLIFFVICFIGIPGSLAQDNHIVAIENVNIVDVIAGELVNEQTVIVEGDSIRSVGPVDSTEVPSNARRIDAGGKYLIPGLWDMHIHWYHESSMKLFPINGVTGVRFMWGSPMHRGWKSKFEAGDSVGPRMLIASTIIDGSDPIWPGSIVASDKESGVEAVDRAIKAKADFAKVYSLLSRDAYFAIAEEATKRGLPFAGHVPEMVTAAEASDAGQRTMEHMYGLLIACSSEADELYKMKRDSIEETGSVRGYFNQRDIRSEITRRSLESYDDEVAAAFFQKLADNQSWQSPTLTVLRNMAYLGEDEVQKNPNLIYVPESVRKMIAPSPESRAFPEEVIKQQRAVFNKNLEILAGMHDADVPILAGTDCLNPFCLPGFSIHTELQLMVRAGLTPAEALQTATINPAKFLDREKELGSIEVGKQADLVLLNANPLEDINNTTKIESVFLRGKLFERKELDEMLESLKD